MFVEDFFLSILGSKIFHTESKFYSLIIVLSGTNGVPNPSQKYGFANCRKIKRQVTRLT